MIVNYVPLRVTGDIVVAGTRPFESREQLRGLRDEIGETHVVFRRGRDVVDVPLLGREPVGSRTTLALAGKERDVASRLITSALIKALTDTWGYRLRSFSPPSFVSRLGGRDLLPQAVPGAPSWMHVYPEYRLTVRGEGPNRLPGVIIGLKTSNEIDAPLAELAGLVDPPGSEVLAQVREPEPCEDALSCRKNVGVVRAVRGTAATVETRNGPEEYSLMALFLAARRETFDAVLVVRHAALAG
jgi:hypothetical protein